MPHDPTQGNPASDEHLDDACRRAPAPIPDETQIEFYMQGYPRTQQERDYHYGGPSNEERANQGDYE